MRARRQRGVGVDRGDLCARRTRPRGARRRPLHLNRRCRACPRRRPRRRQRRSPHLLRVGEPPLRRSWCRALSRWQARISSRARDGMDLAPCAAALTALLPRGGDLAPGGAWGAAGGATPLVALLRARASKAVHTLPQLSRAPRRRLPPSSPPALDPRLVEATAAPTPLYGAAGAPAAPRRFGRTFARNRCRARRRPPRRAAVAAAVGAAPPEGGAAARRELPAAEEPAAAPAETAAAAGAAATPAEAAAF